MKLVRVKPWCSSCWNSNKLVITHTGVTCVEKLNLQNVFIVTQLKMNIVYVSKITANNSCPVEFMLMILLSRIKTIGKGHKKDLLYALDFHFHEALAVVRNN